MRSYPMYEDGEGGNAVVVRPSRVPVPIGIGWTDCEESSKGCGTIPAMDRQLIVPSRGCRHQPVAIQVKPGHHLAVGLLWNVASLTEGMKAT